MFFFKLWFSASEKNKIITELRTFQVEKRRDVNNITISGVSGFSFKLRQHVPFQMFIFPCRIFQPIFVLSLSFNLQYNGANIFYLSSQNDKNSKTIQILKSQIVIKIKNAIKKTIYF